MENLIAILEDIQPEIDYSTCTDLIDAHHLDSLSIIALIAEIEEEFDIIVPTVEIVAENFNSAQALWEMILRLQQED